LQHDFLLNVVSFRALRFTIAAEAELKRMTALIPARSPTASRCSRRASNLARRLFHRPAILTPSFDEALSNEL
jgi:hypothetical protein